ncbi:hypothetical protein FRC07_000743 [Ceratobasidium sp. 392]|nr:hypothetical protein FRC07_000743 [Ceratobasidium sp. 392]
MAETSLAPDPAPTQFVTTIFSTSSDDFSPSTSIGSAAPINGGGPSCVQDCLAKAASNAGCRSSSTFRGLAQNCFGINECEASSASRALGEMNTACRTVVTTSQGGQAPPTQSFPTSSAPTPPPTNPSVPDPTQSNPAATSAPTNRQTAPTTLVLSSGDVITLSGIRTTLVAGFTTVLSQPTGATATKSAGSGTTDGGSNNSAACAKWNLAGLITALLSMIVAGLL